MFGYTIVMLVIAVTAETLGLGGVPPAALTLENIAFSVLLLASVLLALKGYSRR